MTSLARLRMVAQIAFRNLFSHKWKTVIVGSIMFFGTMLVVVGTALLDSIESSMARSITQSVAGHLQVYDADARDPLALFGDAMMGQEDIGAIPDFKKVKTELSKLDNVEAVVPMGITFARTGTGNELDRVLDRLHEIVQSGQPLAGNEAVERGRAQIAQIAELLVPDYELRKDIAADPEEVNQNLEDLARAQSDELWDRFQSEPDQTLQWLDTHIAPLATEGQVLFLRYLGTDLDTYAEHFDRFEIVDGEMVPSGKRGFLFNKKYYEETAKNKVARDFDSIKKARETEDKTIADDELLRSKVKQMVREYPRITLQLDPEDAKALTGKLSSYLEKEGSLNELTQAFLELTDDNFDERFAFFYDEIAPMIQLYPFEIGDVMTIQSVTQSGYTKSVNVKVYGTFTFKGLESSDLAAGHNLMDMMTFRDLYGLMTSERREELDEIREDVGVEAISRSSAEDALFGGGTDSLVAVDESDEGFDEFDEVDLSVQDDLTDELLNATYTQDEIDSGVALNAAIILKEPSRMWQTYQQILKTSKENGLRLQVVDWQTASGIVGQFVIVIRLVLYIAIIIIFTVALVIINNSMVMATMERVREVGTMRAIGAGRRFVMGLFLLETVLLGLLAGSLGGLAGAGIITWLGVSGLPAGSEDVLVFLFSGSYLYPSVSASNLVFGFFVILIVSLISTAYPALIAARIQPVVAMQGKE